MIAPMLSALCLTFATCAAAQPAAAPYALLTLDVSAQVAPVSCPVDFAEVGRSLGITVTGAPLQVVAAQEMPDGGLAPVLCQFDPDAADGAKGTLSVIPLPSASGRAAIRAYFTADAPQFAAVPRQDALTVTQDGDRIVIGNSHYRFTHDAAKMGGLPSRIEWPATGKVFDTFTLNDRIHDPSVQGYNLSNDPTPTVELVAAGPVRAVVRVHARYMRDGQQPASAPEAVYEWSYYAASPIVRAKAHMTQRERMHWNELHMFEINFPDESFRDWAIGPPLTRGALKAEKANIGGGSWTALLDGPNVLGLLDPPGRIYDGRGEYGTYLHGPWASWDALETDLSTALWVGDSTDLAALQTAAPSVRAAMDASISTAPLEQAFAAVTSGIQRLPVGAERGRFAWALDRVRRTASAQGRLTEATRLVQALADALAAGSDAQTAVPWFTLPAGGVLPDGGTVLLDNGQIGVGLQGTDGGLGIVSLYDLAAQRETLIGALDPVWSAMGTVDKDQLQIDSRLGWGAVRLTPGPAGSLSLSWTAPQAPALRGLSATVQLALAGPRASWKLDLDNTSDSLSLHDAFIPSIRLARLGDDAADDTLLYPMGSGIAFKAPLARGFSGFAGLYPSGWSSMQFAAYYDATSGLYVASHDPEAWTKELLLSTESNSVIMKVRWLVPDTTRPGNSFHQPGETAMQVYRGDWFDASMVYKDWVRAHADWWPADETRADTPQWTKDIAVWGQIGGDAKDAVPGAKRFAEFMGVPTAVHWYSWHQIPFDVNYPHYFPVRDGFPEGVKELQDAGVRVMPYINGRLWDTGLEDWQNGANAAGTKDINGKPYIEEYGSGAKLNPMCPTTDIWSDKVQEIVGRLVGEYGVDGVYIDQIAAAAPAPCYDPTHGHPLGGGNYWTVGGYWPMLAELRQQIRDAGLEKFLTTECNAEPYIKWFDGYLTWHFQYQNQVPAFAAIYSGRVQPFSRAYNGTEVAQIMKAGEQLIFGEQLGWCDTGVLTARPAFAGFLRQCAILRYELRDCLAEGEMARPPKLAGDIPEITADWAWSGVWPITTPALRAGSFKARGGRLAVLFANVSEQPITVTWSFDAADYALGNALQMVTQTENGAGQTETVPGKFSRSLTIPPRTAMAYVLSSR